MNKTRWVILGTIIFISLWAVHHFTPQTLEKTDPSLSFQSEILYKNGHLYTGMIIERYLNGELYKKLHYVNGQLEGESREYALGGNLRAKWNFHLGVKDGLQRGWYTEGPKRFEFHFKNGVLEGVQTEWHLNGTEFRRQVYRDGVETEKKILFSGKEIFTNYSKKNGRTYGIDGGRVCMEVKPEGEK
jgi:antitoxin component YwqK of YwqJK toxin-antitoxin module